MQTQIDLGRIKEKCRKRDAEITATVRAAHGRTCSNWQTWTENVKLYEGGRADMTFDGCRTHGIALARVKE